MLWELLKFYKFVSFSKSSPILYFLMLIVSYSNLYKSTFIPIFMEGTIVNFKRGRTVTADNQMIVQVSGVSTKEDAKKLVGKKVAYNTGKKDMIGVVASSHGNSGALRVRFETGMPGQAVGQKVKIN
jgi:large subunit ribosomal protein L35Ae